jgi:hypothetical protein
MDFTEKNNRERLRFVDLWAEYVRMHSDRNWSRQQNVIINSCLRSADISKEAYLKMKAGRERMRGLGRADE